MELLKLVISIAVPPLAALVLMFVRQQLLLVRQRVGETRWFQLELYAGLVVKAAEQAGLTNELLKTGSAKRAWAINELQRLLNERGLTNISTDTLATLIEAKVRDGVHKRPDELWPPIFPEPIKPEAQVFGVPIERTDAAPTVNRDGYGPTLPQVENRYVAGPSAAQVILEMGNKLP